MLEIKKKYQAVIVGMGVAGLNCAYHLPRDWSVLVICKETPDKSDSYLAQGGICCLQGEQDYDSYFEDTMRAGHYENNRDTVDAMIRGSNEVIDDLVACGVQFERRADGTFDCTREGGHSAPRILFHEDCTGKEITSCLMERVRELKNVQMVSYVAMVDLLEEEGECVGIVAKDLKTGALYTIGADYTVLATGGIGGVFENSTNFRVLTGDALAVCMNHGVAVDHINYIQIHPTTLYSQKKGRRFLISESVRGEGALLLDKNYQRFTDELQPRDVVTKAVLAQMEKDGTKHVWLDMRTIDKQELASHFPTIVERCKEEGYDPFVSCVPVVPSQHYFMGGIRSDLQGKTTMPRLYAVGETCCNGVHGKNRLASNSLLESLLFAKRASQDMAANNTPVLEEQLDGALAKVQPQKYENVSQLFQEYKAQVLKAIQEEERL